MQVIIVALIIILVIILANWIKNMYRLYIEKERIIKNINLKYIIVLHRWFIDSKGFKVIYSKATSYQEVEKEAKILCTDNTSTFSTCAYKIITIGEQL